MHSARKYNRTTLISLWCVGILCGIALAKSLQETVDIWLVAVVSLVAIMTFKKRHAFAVVAVVFAGGLFGLWRGASVLPHLEQYKNFYGQKVTLQVVAESAGVYEKNAQIAFDAGTIKLIEPTSMQMPGKMVISGYGVNSILRGDTIQVTGKLYARRGSKVAGISYAQMNVVNRSASVLEEVRRSYLAGLATSLPEPHEQFAAGLLIGQKSGLSDEVNEMLRMVGLSHIIAVSGYNLTIMVDVARKRFGKNSQFRRAFFAICFVLVFVVLAGSSASIARAAFVSIVTIIAGYYGRSVLPHVVLLLAAAVTATVNPLNVWVDIGWYLSFLAFFGVLVLAPALTARLYKKPPKLLGKLLIETIAAQLATLPLVLFIFGDLPIWSLVANILVVPLVPLAMLLSFIAGVAGMFVPQIALLVGMPARLLLGAMLDIAGIVSRLPHAVMTMQFSVTVMVGCYAVMMIIVYVMNQKRKIRTQSEMRTKVV